MKEATLAKIEHDMAMGDLGMARDRLHGLVSTYPEELTLRRMLGDVYWQLQFPAMAGRYWYLEEDKTSAMAAACRAFEQSCGNDPLQMLLALKFKGDMEPIRDTFAGHTLLALREQAKTKHGLEVHFGKRGAAKYGHRPLANPSNRFYTAACIIVLIVAVALMLVGLTAILMWIF